MTRFNDLALFDSGPHRFEPVGLEQRHALHPRPDADGAGLTALGRSPRRLIQDGTLLADDPAGLQAQQQAIEALLDGNAYPLVDDLGRAYDRMVMIAFRPGRPRRLGPRWAMDYRVEYLQSR